MHTNSDRYKLPCNDCVCVWCPCDTYGQPFSVCIDRSYAGLRHLNYFSMLFYQENDPSGGSSISKTHGFSKPIRGPASLGIFWKSMLQVRLELTTSAWLRKLNTSTAYKYGALTDCATGARRQRRVLKQYQFWAWVMAGFELKVSDAIIAMAWCISWNNGLCSLSSLPHISHAK